MESILVTGSSGFLGSQVVELALKENLKVIGVDIKPPITNNNNNDFQFILMDVNDIGLQDMKNISFIVHTASSLPYGNSRSEFEQNNVDAARKISQFARTNNLFLVEIGSSSVYGKPNEIPVSRNTQPAPLDSYARSKLQAEKEIEKNLSGDSYAIIRPRTILGSGRRGIFEIFFGIILRSLPLPLPNNGNQIIQFVHVKDLSRLSIFLGQNKIAGIWPAASPEPKSLISYLVTLASEFGLKVRFFPINPWIFKTLGGILYRIRVTKFTPWHFGAFPHDNYVTPEWKPNGFHYLFTCQEAFNETFETCAENRGQRSTRLRIGKSI
jgi:nucleoside-diphosphate-sugar epimerase